MGPRTGDNDDVTIYHPTEMMTKSQYTLTPFMTLGRLKVCPTVRISDSIGESVIFNESGQRKLERKFKFVRGIVFETAGFELEKMAARTIRKYRQIPERTDFNTGINYTV